MADREWKKFGYRLASIKQSLRSLEYTRMLEAPAPAFQAGNAILHRIPAGALALSEIDLILSASALAPPHGLDLLRPVPVPKLPDLPSMPGRSPSEHDAVPEMSLRGLRRLWGNDPNVGSALRSQKGKSYEEQQTEEYETLKQQINAKRDSFIAKMRDDEKMGGEISAACKLGNTTALRQLMSATLARHPLPGILSRPAEFALDPASRVALCTIEVPDLSRLPIVRKRGDSWSAKWLPVSDAERTRSSERVLYSMCIRAAYLVAMSDPGEFFDTVTVNAHQEWFDPATGNPREGIIASLQATKSEIQRLQPGQLDAKACFRHLSGISTPSIQSVAPIRPIFVMDTADSRIVANRDVASNLAQETNLATMPWEDFEHLVRQLFEWMFTNEGVEVRVTRASRDRGVDAIMFDPDPLRGGKYVLQAKRYTRTVDVAAVRDLYGTILNEGANRGILVTTASYGPDAYEFAKNKPISLIDGPNLIALLLKHGRKYRIDLDEARRTEDRS